MKKQKDSFNVIEEDVAEEICDQCKSAEEFYSKLDLKISQGYDFNECLMLNNISINVYPRNENSKAESDETIITDLKEQTKIQNSSEHFENTENDSPRSCKTLTPKEKVRLWLPNTGVESDEINDNEMIISKKEDSDDEKIFNESFETVIAAKMT